MYLAVKNYNLPNKNAVYRIFVKWVKESKYKTEDLLKDIVQYAEAYYSVYRKDINELDSAIRDSIKEFRRILSEMPAPALMEFYLLYKNKKISEETFSQLIQIVNCYMMRRALCDLNTNNITRLFPVFIRDVLDECDGDYSNIINVVGKNLVTKNIGNTMYMPNDTQMRDSIATANMYNIRAVLRVFFDKLEHKNNPAPVDLSSLSVEHIMPQTKSKEWMEALKIDEETYNYNLHRLGNLTLAAKSDNSIMGNKIWEYKNEILKSTSHLKINEKILEVKKWNVEEIEKRTDALIDRIIELYPYPEINEDIIQRVDIFLDYKGAVAMGHLSLEDGSVEIEPGSILLEREDADSFQGVEDARQELIEDEYIAEVDGKLQFVKPYIVYSSFKGYTALSSSANIIAHGSKNGWYYWKDKDGRPLKDNAEIRSHFIDTDND